MVTRSRTASLARRTMGTPDTTSVYPGARRCGRAAREGRRGSERTPGRRFSRSYISGALSKLGNRELADAFQRTLFPVGAVRFNDLAKADAFPDTNLVQFSTYAELGVIAEPQLVHLRDTRRGFAYASPRGRGAYHLIVAGRSDQDVLAVIKTLGSVDALVGPGLVVSVD